MFQPRDLFDDDLLGELKARDAIDVQSTRPGPFFVNDYRVAITHQFFATAKPAGPLPTTATRRPVGGAMT